MTGRSSRASSDEAILESCGIEGEYEDVPSDDQILNQDTVAFEEAGETAAHLIQAVTVNKIMNRYRRFDDEEDIKVVENWDEESDGDENNSEQKELVSRNENAGSKLAALKENSRQLVDVLNAFRMLRDRYEEKFRAIGA